MNFYANMFKILRNIIIEKSPDIIDTNYIYKYNPIKNQYGEQKDGPSCPYGYAEISERISGYSMGCYLDDIDHELDIYMFGYNGKLTKGEVLIRIENVIGYLTEEKNNERSR